MMMPRGANASHFLLQLLFSIDRCPSTRGSCDRRGPRMVSGRGDGLDEEALRTTYFCEKYDMGVGEDDGHEK